MHQLQPNTLLQGGRYKIINMLGQGGFGITYLAIQSGLERKVAVKEFFMKELCNRDKSTSHVTLGTEGSRETVNRFREKFLKEARNIAKLNHPNIVRIIDVFEENGTAYYVMEYAENGSLADRLKREGYLSEPVATRYIKQIAEALDYIHQRKMNHLDVKPANVMLNEKDEAVLIDFGLSKQYDASTGNQTSTTPVGISEGYAPMEQYMQGGVGAFSPETDIYALGATFYKLLTGITPPNASLVNNEGLPIEELKAKGVVQNTINAILKAMEGLKKNRIKTARVFIDSLIEELTSEETIILPEPEEDNRQKTKAPITIQNSKTNKNWIGILLGIIFIAVIGVVISINIPERNAVIEENVVSDENIDSEESQNMNDVNVHSTEPDIEVSHINNEEIVNIHRRIKQNAFVRSGPGTSYEPLYSPYNDFDSNHTNGVVVYEGTIVEVLSGEENGFVKVRQTTNNNDRDEWGEGWVSAKFLE